ncbi:MAG: twin-arginine translocase subunit TatC [Actinomyces sp.]|jgi:sec-independent protein translocase protein TatC|nr:twin-arginine translocase subunit TatC [Actinomyces sp.]MCI1788755.1 twin-arginine translocase subunit TatC [Actinomyces sp.]
MSVLDHLRELRKRLLWTLPGVIAGVVAGWLLYDPMLGYFGRMLSAVGDTAPQLNFQTIGGALDLKFSVAVWLGLILSSPWWILQIVLFIGPGLRHREKLFVAAFGVSGVALFLAGAYVGILAIPQAVEALMSFVPDQAAVLLRADGFISFCTKLIMAFGLSFLTPEILVGLNFAGLLSGRAMLKGWRIAVIVSFVFAAIVNPVPNPIPMIIQALAIVALYFLAVGISALHDRRRARRTAAAEA